MARWALVILWAVTVFIEASAVAAVAVAFTKMSLWLMAPFSLLWFFFADHVREQMAEAAAEIEWEIEDDED